MKFFPPRLRRIGRILGVPSHLVGAWILAAACGGCASPVEGLWPPRPGEPTRRVVVAMDSWHSVVAVWPEGDPEGLDPAARREWAYAEKAWYLEGSRGSCGSLRALLWPTDGVVVVRRDGRPLEEWSPDPPVRSWEFRLSEDGWRALRGHLEAERASPDPVAETDGFLWYDATRSYHAFHHCHHWTARALRAAGLPVTAFWAPFRWALEAQLDRAAGMQEEGP